MAVRTITTRLVVDGEAAFKKAMGGANASLRELRSELTLAETQFKGQANTLEALTRKQDILSRTYEQQAEKVRALKQAVQDATEAWGASDTTTLRYQNDLNRAQAELLRMGEALEEVNGYLREAQNSADNTAFSIDEFGSSTDSASDSVNTLASALAAAGVVQGLREIARAIQACVNASVEFERAMAGVQKVTKMSDGDLLAMAEEVKALSTELPATTTEIAAVAESAARLGIARKDIMSFTRVMLDLGESSNLSADEAATALARFANIAGTSSDNYERLGSTIVALGNNFATSEAEITAMASRLASAGTLAGLTESEIMALAAAMSSVGIEAEAGGTAMTQTLTAIEKAVTEGGSKLSEFARIAGMSSGEFAAAWKGDAVSAIQAFIAGLGGLDEAGESATAALDTLGLSGVRQSNMLKSLGLAAETLAGAVDTANTAWAQNTELAATAAARYETTEAKMQMAANAANNLKIAIGDALTPALGGLAEAGTAGFGWLTEVAERHPGFVAGVSAMIGVIGLFTGGVTAYTVASKLAAVASTELAAAMNLIPGVAVVTAVTGIVVALGTLAAKASEARTASDELLESLESSQSAFDDTIISIQKQGDSLLKSVSALQSLAEVENKSALEKETLLALVNELNEAVPNLTLAYDEQTDSLNMSADAIRALAQAEVDRQEQAAAVDRMVELTRERTSIEEQLTAAVDARTAAEQELQRVEAQIAIGNYSEKVTEYELALEDARAEVDRLTDSLSENQAQQDALLAKYNAAAETTEETAGAYQELTGEVDTLTASVSVLADALKEQEAQGRLSEETARALADAGYAAALATDEETGAVTLNKAAYIELATAKINEQIASLETQRQSALTADRVMGEAEAARHAGSAYWDMAGAQAAAAAFSGDSASSLADQITALKQARAELQRFAGASESASRASSSRAAKAQTEAERDLAAYKELRAELDHQKNLELVAEREYYLQLKEYRDQYLTDEGNVDEYRRVTEQIYKYDKALADSEAALWAEQTEALADELEDRVNGIESQRQNIEKKLSGYGELFTKDKSGKYIVEDLQKQTDAMEEFYNNIEELRNRGVSNGLLSDILGMSIDDARGYTDQLLALGPEELEKYTEQYETKQKLAADIAEQIYKDQLKTLETEYNAKLGEALEPLQDTAKKSGEDTAQGLIDGLASKEAALYAKLRAMEQKMADILKSAWQNIVPSNAEIAASLNPEELRTEPPATARDVRGAVAAGVNGMQTALAGVGAENSGVTGAVYLDSQQVGRILLPGLRKEAKANPEVVDDT